MADADTAANKASDGGGGKNYTKKQIQERAKKERLRVARAASAATCTAASATGPHSSSPPLTDGHVTGQSPPSDIAAPVAHSSRGRKRKRTSTAAQETSAPPPASACSLPSADASSSKPTDTPENLRRRYDAIRGGLLKGNADEQADMLYDILTDPNFEAARLKLGSRLWKSKEASAESAVRDLTREDDSSVRSPSSDTSPMPGEEARQRQPHTAIATDSSTPSQRAHPSVAPRYGGRQVDLTKAAISTPVNENAFDTDRRAGRKRTKNAAERQKQRMTRNIQGESYDRR